MKLAVPTLPLFNQSKVHLQPDGEKLVFYKEEKCLMVPSANYNDDVEACKNCKSSGKSLKLAFLLIICKSSGNPSNWHSPFFETVPDGRTDGRTNEQTYPLIDLLAAGKN